MVRNQFMIFLNDQEGKQILRLTLNGILARLQLIEHYELVARSQKYYMNWCFRAVDGTLIQQACWNGHKVIFQNGAMYKNKKNYRLNKID